MSALTLDDITALEALLARGAPKPWRPDLDCYGGVLDAAGSGVVMSGADTAEHDTALIIAAVGALPDLLALARRPLEAPDAPPSDSGANPLDTPADRAVEAAARAIHGAAMRQAGWSLAWHAEIEATREAYWYDAVLALRAALGAFAADPATAGLCAVDLRMEVGRADPS